MWRPVSISATRTDDSPQMGGREQAQQDGQYGQQPFVKMHKERRLKVTFARFRRQAHARDKRAVRGCVNLRFNKLRIVKFRKMQSSQVGFRLQLIRMTLGRIIASPAALFSMIHSVVASAQISSCF